MIRAAKPRSSEIPPHRTRMGAFAVLRFVIRAKRVEKWRIEDDASIDSAREGET